MSSGDRPVFPVCRLSYNLAECKPHKERIKTTAKYIKAMTKSNINSRMEYSSPSLEIFRIGTEKGFAASGGGSWSGPGLPYDDDHTNNYGPY